MLHVHYRFPTRADAIQTPILAQIRALALLVYFPWKSMLLLVLKKISCCFVQLVHVFKVQGQVELLRITAFRLFVSVNIYRNRKCVYVCTIGELA